MSKFKKLNFYFFWIFMDFLKQVFLFGTFPFLFSTYLNFYEKCFFGYFQSLISKWTRQLNMKNMLKWNMDNQKRVFKDFSLSRSLKNTLYPMSPLHCCPIHPMIVLLAIIMLFNPHLSYDIPCHHCCPIHPMIVLLAIIMLWCRQCCPNIPW